MTSLTRDSVDEAYDFLVPIQRTVVASCMVQVADAGRRLLDLPKWRWLAIRLATFRYRRETLRLARAVANLHTTEAASKHTGTTELALPSRFTAQQKREAA